MQRAIVITGASSGIGAATARLLAGQVEALFLHARSSGDKLESVAEEVRVAGTEVVTSLGDLTLSGTASSLVEMCHDAFGTVDGLVANAGFPVMKSIEDGTLEDLEHAFRGNLFSFFELARAARPFLRHSETPRIVAVGSFTAHVFRTDLRQFPVSAASKGALETAVRSLAVAFAPEGITVNCVVPGFIAKEEGTRDGLDDAEQAATRARIPIGRLGDPRDVAAMISFLVSPDAGYVTGQCIHVNGGLI